MILGSFGASAVLLYAAPQVPLSQPRHVIRRDGVAPPRRGPEGAVLPPVLVKSPGSRAGSGSGGGILRESLPRQSPPPGGRAGKGRPLPEAGCMLAPTPPV